MAERRMFAKTIIDSDAFIDMPVTARLLYYDLSMRADDDGFVNSPKKIMRMIGASQDDLSILAVRKFIIPFENGIVVIKHWRIHNYIRKDTYNPTPYSEQKCMLEFDENNAYRLVCDDPSTERIQTVDDTSTQVRIGKDRLGKDRIDTLADKPQQSDSQIQEVVDAFHSICLDLPKIRTVTKQRKSAIKARISENGFDAVVEAFRKAQASDFLTGKKSDFTASFDWIMKPSNFCKILEGNYDNRPAQVQKPQPQQLQRQPYPPAHSSIDMDEIQKLFGRLDD